MPIDTTVTRGPSHHNSDDYHQYGYNPYIYDRMDATPVGSEPLHFRLQDRAMAVLLTGIAKSNKRLVQAIIYDGNIANIKGLRMCRDNPRETVSGYKTKCPDDTATKGTRLFGILAKRFAEQIRSDLEVLLIGGIWRLYNQGCRDEHVFRNSENTIAAVAGQSMRHLGIDPVVLVPPAPSGSIDTYVDVLPDKNTMSVHQASSRSPKEAYLDIPIFAPFNASQVGQQVVEVWAKELLTTQQKWRHLWWQIALNACRKAWHTGRNTWDIAMNVLDGAEFH